MNKKKTFVLGIALALAIVIITTFVSLIVIKIKNTKERPTPENRYREYIASSDIVNTDYKYGDKNHQGLTVYSPKDDEQLNRQIIILLQNNGVASEDSGSPYLIKKLAYDYARMGYVCVIPELNYGTERTEYIDVTIITNLGYAVDWVYDNAEIIGGNKEAMHFIGYSTGAEALSNLLCTNKYSKLEKSGIQTYTEISGAGLKYDITATKYLPKCLLIHGDNDEVVEYSECQKLYDELKSKDADVELYPLKNINHDVMNSYEEIRNKIAEFMYEKYYDKKVKMKFE